MHDEPPTRSVAVRPEPRRVTPKSQPLPPMRKLTAAGRSAVAYVLIDGRKRRLGPWGSHEAMDAYRAIVNGHGRSTPATPAARGTVADLAGRFLAEASVIYRKHGRPTQSMANIRIVVRLVHAAGLADTRLDEVGPLWLKMFQRWLAAHPDQRWARATINEYVAIAVRMFAFGVSEEIIGEDLIGRLRTVRPLRRGRGVVGRSTPLREHRTVEAVDRLLLRRSCRHLPWELRILVNLQLLTGMRPIEVCAIRPCLLHATGVPGVVVYRVPADANKTDHHNIAREVYLGPRAQRLLGMVTPASPSDYYVSPARVTARLNAERSATRVSKRWPSHSHAARNARDHDGRTPNHGDRYTPDSYRRAINRACGKAFGVDATGNPVVWWSPNQLRHAAATAIANSVDLHLASRALGHRDIKTTLRYVHPTDQQLAGIAASRA